MPRIDELLAWQNEGSNKDIEAYAAIQMLADGFGVDICSGEHCHKPVVHLHLFVFFSR